MFFLFDLPKFPKHGCDFLQESDKYNKKQQKFRYFSYFKVFFNVN